jgi:DNA-directed RNA polymerase subunit RPC12/RpoP
MSSTTYYIQECPTCGRNLQVRVEYLGKKVVCQHCASKFVACDPSSADYDPMESGIGLLSKVDELIETASRVTPGLSASGTSD